MRILVVTWDGGGNVPPAVELGRRLVRAGHQVTVHGPPSLAARLAGAHLDHVRRDAADEWDPLAMALDARSAVESNHADVVVVDYMLPPAICAAVASRRRVVALVHTLYGALLVDGAPSPMAMAATAPLLTPARRALGLGPVERLGQVLDECDAALVLVPEELDLVPEGLPANVRYVGPVLEGPGEDEGWRPPGEGDPTHPSVVVTLGTTPMGEERVLQAALDALAELPVSVLAMLPGHIDPSALRLPDNATSTGYVRHAAVFPHAGAVVSHAGLGTVTSALAHGVPLVCVPLGRDQPENASAVARVGAGVVVDPSDVPTQLAGAVERVLASAAIGASADRMATAIAAHTTGPEVLAAVLGTA